MPDQPRTARSLAARRPSVEVGRRKGVLAATEQGGRCLEVTPRAASDPCATRRLCRHCDGRPPKVVYVAGGIPRPDGSRRPGVAAARTLWNPAIVMAATAPVKCSSVPSRPGSAGHGSARRPPPMPSEQVEPMRPLTSSRLGRCRPREPDRPTDSSTRSAAAGARCGRSGADGCRRPH